MTTPLTKLEAINSILGVIGESPVNSLTGPLTADVQLALQCLDNVSRQLQTIGWYFNTDSDVTLTPDAGNQEIQVGLNVVWVDALDPTVQVVQRGSRLYDKVRRVFTFDQPLKVKMIYLLPFDELPESAKWYITELATQRFQKRALGSPQVDALTAAEVAQARVLFHRSDSNSGGYTIFDNYSVSRVLDRRIRDHG